MTPDTGTVISSAWGGDGASTAKGNDMDALTKIDMARIEANMELFLVRDQGFSFVDMRIEVEMIKRRVGFLAFAEDSNSYLRMRRIGARKTLTRHERKSIVASLENAVNHALSIE